MENKTAPTGNKRQLFGFRSYLRPKKLLVAIIVLAILAIGISWAGQRYQDHQITKLNTYLPSESEYYKQHKAELASNPPAENAPEADKLKYYDELQNNYANLGEYKNAVSAYEKRIAISTDGLLYTHYLRVAGWYHQAGNNKAGLELIDKVEQLLPATDNIQTGFYRSDYMEQINKARAEWR